MEKLQSKFKQIAITKEVSKLIKGGENATTAPLATNLAITDPLRKKDKK